MLSTPKIVKLLKPICVLVYLNLLSFTNIIQKLDLNIYDTNQA